MNESLAVAAPRALRRSNATVIATIATARAENLDRAWWETPVRWFIVLALVAAWPVALSRVINQGGTDYNYLCNCGRHLLEYGTREPTSALNRYWPSCDVPWMLLACLPAVVGSTLWYALNSWSYLQLLRTIESQLLAGAPEHARRQATLIVGLIALPLVVDGLWLGTFHVFMVWFMVAGLLAVRDGRAWRGALWLGAATWMKLLPLIGVAYLVYKRRYAPALGALAVAVAIDVVLSVAAFGPAQAWREHVSWWNDNASATLERELGADAMIDEDRLTNQSLAITLRRVLSSLGAEPGMVRERVQVMDLSAEHLRWAYLAISAALGLGIAVFCRRPDRQTDDLQARSEIALFTMATLWFSPVVWSYHPTAAIPAMAIIFCRTTVHSFWTRMVTAVWLTSIVLLTWQPARAAGDLLWMSLLVGGVLVWVSVRGSPTSRLSGAIVHG